MSEGDPDRPLVERARAELPYGTAAYEELVRKHGGAVYRRAYSILRSESDAEEATQDVFLAVFRGLGRFRFERPFQHWLSIVTLNACRMILRKRAAEQRRRDAVETHSPPPAPTAEPDSLMRDLVLGLLDRIEEGTRVVLLMRFVEGFTFPEIAAQLDLSESAVKMRASRGAKQLRALYEEASRTKGPEESEDGGT